MLKMRVPPAPIAALALVLASALPVRAQSARALIRSSWFPLYDRSPQTFVPSIFWAKPEDFRKATQRIHHAPGQASFVALPLVAAADR